MTVAGDRRRFLGRLRARLADEIPSNPAHPLPPPVHEVPAIGYRSVQPDDLVGSFEAAATAAGARVHRCVGPEIADELLIDLLARYGVRRAVVSEESMARTVGGSLTRLGIDVEPTPASPGTSAAADVGVTSAIALVAATGSVVLDSSSMRTRAASLLPPLHLCVAATDLVVRSPSEVLRPLTGHPERLPSNLIFVTGPSRTGDIEQLLTIGVHGPVAVEIVLTEPRVP